MFDSKNNLNVKQFVWNLTFTNVQYLKMVYIIIPNPAEKFPKNIVIGKVRIQNLSNMKEIEPKTMLR